jgi:hypothetical protein
MPKSLDRVFNQRRLSPSRAVTVAAKTHRATSDSSMATTLIRKLELRELIKPRLDRARGIRWDLSVPARNMVAGA